MGSTIKVEFITYNAVVISLGSISLGACNYRWHPLSHAGGTALVAVSAHKTHGRLCLPNVAGGQNITMVRALEVVRPSIPLQIRI